MFNLSTPDGHNQCANIDGWITEFGNREKGKWSWVVGCKIEEIIVLDLHTKVKNNQNGCVHQKNIIQWNDYNPQKVYVKQIADKTIDNFKKLKKKCEARLQPTAVNNPLLR